MVKKIGMFVIAAFVAAFFWAYSAEPARAEVPEPAAVVVSLGHTWINSDNSVGEVAWLLPGQRWELGAMVIGQGDTKRGPITGHVRVYSVSRLVRPDWQLLGGEPYFRLGLAYLDGHPLVGPGNYRLGWGIRWRVLALELGHFSSGGINDPNTGVDGLQLRAPITFRL